MKFVHLTESKHIGRIRRNGIRKGRGRRGNGVYAMPLCLIFLEVDTDPNLWPNSPNVFSEPVSTSRFWSFLFPDTRKGESKAAAIVFSLPDNCWPISLYILTSSQWGPALLDWLVRHDENEIVVPKDIAAFATDTFGESARVSIEVLVGSSKALGVALHEYQRIGGRPMYKDEIEAGIRLPIPATYAKRVIPFYRSSAEWKSSRGRTRDDPRLIRSDEEMS